jgi:glutathione S-transferase
MHRSPGLSKWRRLVRHRDMETAAMKLYEFGPTRSIRARWALQELGVGFEAITVDLRAGEHRRAEFLRVNPAGKVPVLVDGDVVVPESVAILVYLAEKYPEGGLLPEDVAVRSQVHRWLLFATTELEQPLWRIVRHTRLYDEQDRLPADVTLAGRDFAPMAAVVEAHLRDREYLVGGDVTVADLVMAYTLDWANEATLLGDFPGLRRYMERMYRRPNAAPRIATAFAALERG